MKNRPILLVEDNPDDEALALRAFRNSGIMNDIVVVRDGVEALDYLFVTGSHADRMPATNPSVVLLDLKLPKLDGLDVLKEIRRNSKTRRLPVVILTSSKEDRDLIESYDRGANSYVRKPVDFNEFAEAVTKLGIYWLLLNQTSD